MNMYCTALNIIEVVTHNVVRNAGAMDIDSIFPIFYIGINDR
jgi:hypothetical protein